ncbi:MAG: PilZ domain-containing protein [Candidatus Omnitrophica bacterium]|nr:PilZ domain-containing protein [Candidatus Omnitrophota bacterium]
MKEKYKGPERRRFTRIDYAVPLDYRICKRSTIQKLLQGYTSNISEAGIMCQINQKVKPNDLLWLSFNRNTLSICEQLEKNCFIYQSGIIGKVVWVKKKTKDKYNVGLRFITRQEKNLTNIYPKFYFLEKLREKQEK